MFIAGTYMLYSPPGSVTTPYSVLSSGTTAASATALDRSALIGKKARSFRVADLLSERDLVPRKAACVVVTRTTSSNNDNNANNDIHNNNNSSISNSSSRSSIAKDNMHQHHPYLHHQPDYPTTPPTSGVDSRELKFGMDRILSDDVTSRKVTSSPSEPPSPSPSQECPSPACSVPSSWTSCLSRCCPLPSCRCNGNQILEPYPLYPYSALSIIGQPLVSYPSSIYSQSVEARHHQLVGHHPSSHQASGGGGGGGKRKRSWSRAVFSNLQRKGLEKRFQIQKYITKPDRRQLAATLGLTDAQVKVWFQNRRMKWRHSKEAREQFRADKKTDGVSPSSTTTAAAVATTTVATSVNENQPFQQQHTQQQKQQCLDSKSLSSNSTDSERTKSISTVL